MAHVLILGGGFGGLAAATEARRLLPDEHTVTVVSVDDRFYMGFAKLWDLGGQRPLEGGTRSLRALEDRGIELRITEVTAIDPEARRVSTADGDVGADALVVALGAVPNPAHRALLDPSGWAFDLYDGSQLPFMHQALDHVEAGAVLVTILGGPFKCPPAPYEAALLVDERLRARGVRDRVEVVVATPQPITLPAAGPDASRYVAGFLDERGIQLRTGHPVTSLVRGASGDWTAAFDDGATLGGLQIVLGVPATAPPPVLDGSGLAGPSGFIHPDRHTLETGFDGVYAIGDCTTIPNANGALPKAGVFAAAQGEVVAGRIAASLGASAAEAPTFDGHGYCFLEVPGPKVAFVEGDFYADPPEVTLSEADAEQFRRKQDYERTRLDAWLG